MFLEGKIIGRMYGDAARDFHAIQGLGELQDCVSVLWLLCRENQRSNQIQFPSQLEGQLKNNPELSKLVVDLTGVNPDDTYSCKCTHTRICGRKFWIIERFLFSVQLCHTWKVRSTELKSYSVTKLHANWFPISFDSWFSGQNFLRYLEDLFGGPTVFEPFFRYYIEKYKNKSVDSDDVKATLYEYFNGKADDKLAEVDWDLWLYGEGGVPIVPKYDTSQKDAVHQQADIWCNNTLEDIKKHPNLNPAGLQVWQLIEILCVLVQQPVNVSITEEWIQLLEQTYGFVDSKNCEILHGLCRLYIKGRLMNRLDKVLAFANSNFRIRYIRPIYRALNGWPEARPKAIANFQSVKNQMMRCVRTNIYKDLELEPEDWTTTKHHNYASPVFVNTNTNYNT